MEVNQKRLSKDRFVALQQSFIYEMIISVKCQQALRFISLLLFVLLLQGAMNSDMRHSDIELFSCVEKQSVSKLKTMSNLLTVSYLKSRL